ncbi:hypothetical protein ABID39_001474 [Bartonella japonica]|uniref:Uncharacterized protein n=1 Tax=Bartonella japonica TaxID=357761 RepID=A0ABV2FQN5_9HYPH
MSIVCATSHVVTKAPHDHLIPWLEANCRVSQVSTLYNRILRTILFLYTSSVGVIILKVTPLVTCMAPE